MPRLTTLLVVPGIGDEPTFVSLAARLAHYFGHLDLERITISCTPALLAMDPLRALGAPRLHVGLDPEVATRIPRLLPKLALHPVEEGVGRLPNVDADVVLMWDTGVRSDAWWQPLLERYRPQRSLFDVDWRRTRADGSWFAEASLVLGRDHRGLSPRESRTFATRTEHLMDSPKAFLVATGPSAREALAIDMDGGVRIACNTAILDDELMSHVRPHIVTFADPIFHFGPSTYACQFQRALARQAEAFDFTAVTLERFAPLLRSRLPVLADRVVGVRVGTHQWPQNYDLTRQLAVRPFPNILTMLMLPLASTFSQTIEMIGFDGRSPDESYFWRHGATVQFEEELDQIRHVHPGFFNVDYEDYYERHLVSVEECLADLELRGATITPRTASYMLPLRRRTSVSPAPGAGVAQRLLGPRLLSVTPDWVSDFGHFGPWERSLRSAARALGYGYRSLASKALVPVDDSEAPTFTYGTLGQHSAFIERFEAELRAALDADSAAVDIVCFYAADVWHVPAFLRVAADRPATTFVVNLMRGHRAILDGELDGVHNARLKLLDACLTVGNGTNVHICVDTQALADEVRAVTGKPVLVWPMIATGDRDMLRTAGRGAMTGLDSTVSMVAPVHAQNAKGFGELARLAERLRPRIEAGEVALTMRAPAPGIEIANFVIADELRETGVRLAATELTDREYAELVGRADIVLLPYRLATFRTRTSGVFLDALAAGKPLVAVQGTWAGDLIDRHGLGVTYEDADIDSMHQAVQRALDQVDALTRAVEDERDALLAMFHPSWLVAFFADLAASANPPPGARDLALMRQVERLATGTWQVPPDREADRVDHLVALDDVRRLRDDAIDQVEHLRRSNRQRQRELDRLRGQTQAPPSAGKPAGAPAPSEHATPEIAALTATLEGNIYERSAGAHLDELALVAQVVDPKSIVGGVMIDVGAHRGSAFRGFRAAGWHVRAFEPDPRHTEYLSERFGDDPHVVLDTRAVSNVTGEKVTFYVSEESTGISGLSAFRDSHVAIGEVETVALRDLPDLDRVDLLKVDTEGYELFVLEGFPWDRLMPAVVVAEFEDGKTVPLGYRTADLIGFLRERGYQVWVSEWHPIVRYGIKHQWHRLANSDDVAPSSDSWGNLIAFGEPVTSDAMAQALVSVLTVEPK